MYIPMKPGEYTMRMKAGLVYPIGPNQSSTWSMNVITSMPRPQLRMKVAAKNRHAEPVASSPCRTGGRYAG